MVSCSCVRSSSQSLPPESVPLLCEQYRRYALEVRRVTLETACKQLAYLKKFFLSFGSLHKSEELLNRLYPKMIAGFLTEYSETHGTGARNWMHLSLRMFLRFCHEYCYLDRDLSFLVPAVRRPRLSRIPRCLPDECIAALGRSIDSGTAAGCRDAAIVWLLATYGVRGVQIRRLRFDHIDWSNDRIHFPAAKGGRPIDQHLTVEVGNRLSEYIVRSRPVSPCPEVFLTLTEPFRPVKASCLSWILRRRIEALHMELPDGISRGTHGFRHAFAARMTGRIPFKDISDLMGHCRPDSTMVYGKIDTDALQQAALPWPGGTQ